VIESQAVTHGACGSHCRKSDVEFIPVSTPSLSAQDAEAVAQAVTEGWISAEGPQVGEFEARFAKLVGKKHGIAVSNGTAALDISLECLDIGPGDEVILPSFTIVSCLNHILRSGATPVFVDSLPDTWNIDPESVKKAITSRTKAIIVVHIYGLPADIDAICQIGAEHGVPIVEDSAEAHGQHLQGKPLGSWGDISTFSFYSNKLITTGEGGMVLTDNDQYAARLRELRNLSFNPDQRFVHHSIGWNYRLTAIQAALGLSQLDRIDALLHHKQEIGRHYQELLSDCTAISLPLNEYRGSENVYWVFGVLLPESSPYSAKELMERLQERGIGTRPFFYPLHRQPVLAKYGHDSQSSLPVSEHLGEKGLYIPNGADSTAEIREYVAKNLREALEE
jgi:perosamine synthetase